MVTLTTLPILRRPSIPDAPTSMLSILDSITGSTIYFSWQTGSTQNTTYDSTSLYFGTNDVSMVTLIQSGTILNYTSSMLAQGTRYIFLLRGENNIDYSVYVSHSVFTNCSASLVQYNVDTWWKSTHFDGLFLQTGSSIQSPWTTFVGNNSLIKSSNQLPTYQQYLTTPYVTNPFRSYAEFSASKSSASFDRDNVMYISTPLIVTSSSPYTVMALLRPISSSTLQSNTNTNTLFSTVPLTGSGATVRWYTSNNGSSKMGWSLNSDFGSFPKISSTGSNFVNYDIASLSSSSDYFRLVTFVTNTASITAYENTHLIGSTGSLYYPSSSISCFGGITDLTKSTDYLNADVMELAVFTGSALTKDQIHLIYTDYYNIMYPHLPYQYYTESLISALIGFSNAAEITPGVAITFSGSYVYNSSGSIRGWVTGMPESTYENLYVKLYYVRDIEYDSGLSSSLGLAGITMFQNYSTDHSGSFGASASSYIGDRSEYYATGQIVADVYYPLNNTTSMCYADIIFSQSYESSYLGLISGSVLNLQSGSYSDYWVYPYRQIDGDMLYAFPPPGSCSIDANGQWSMTSLNAGYVIAKMYPKGMKDLSKPAAIAGMYPSYFNIGLDGFYFASTSSVTDGNGFIQDLGRVFGFTGTKAAKLYRLSDNKEMASSDGLGFGSWVIMTSNTSSKDYKLFDTSSKLWTEAWNGAGLIRSYANPPNDPIGYKRTYIYDQGIALVAFCNINNYSMAEKLANGAMVAQQLPSYQWSFSTNCISGEYLDNYYRTGAQMWMAEGLAYFLRKYPNSLIYNQVTQSLKNYWSSMFYDYWVGISGSNLCWYTGSSPYSSSGYQLHSFLGGRGDYGSGGGFTASYIIPWASTEHNTDAWFALRETARVIPDWSASLEASASLLGEQLFHTYWNETQNRGYQGITNPRLKDGQHALDVSSWYGMFQDSYGNLNPISRSTADFRFSGSLALVPDYFTSSAWSGNWVDGFVPYVAKWGYDSPPLNNPSVWIEGSAGAFLALRRGGQHKLAFRLYKNLLPTFNLVTGFPYALTASADSYEIGNSGSVASTAWMIVAGHPNGFWECPF